MGFQSKTIASVIQDLNTETFVPAIQREFVWTEKQIIQLFDSVLRNYPIGSLLFWRVRGDAAQEQIKYKFVQHYITDPVHPEGLGNVDYRNPEVEEYEDVPYGIQLVLDGQQRLTALYIGLGGTLTTKQKHRHRTTPNAWDRKQLYLNVLSDPDDISEDDLKMRYEFAFKNDPDASKGEYWYRVKDILELNEYESIYDLKEEIGTELAEQGIDDPAYWRFIDQNLTALYRAVHEQNHINYDAKEEEDLGKVLDMFIRTNRGGTQLSTSEVLLSIATAQWTNGSGAASINAREEITEFIDELNRRHQDAGFVFDIDFALRNLLMLSDLPTSESVRHFNQSNLRMMKDTWTNNGEMQQAVRNAVDLVVDFGTEFSQPDESERHRTDHILLLYERQSESGMEQRPKGGCRPGRNPSMALHVDSQRYVLGQPRSHRTVALSNTDLAINDFSWRRNPPRTPERRPRISVRSRFARITTRWPRIRKHKDVFISFVALSPWTSTEQYPSRCRSHIPAGSAQY
jgi:uncharacterized protein with ParB-like and HNH nuclease domain